jgi:hypothetical protein
VVLAAPAAEDGTVDIGPRTGRLLGDGTLADLDVSRAATVARDAFVRHGGLLGFQASAFVIGTRAKTMVHPVGAFPRY